MKKILVSVVTFFFFISITVYATAQPEKKVAQKSKATVIKLAEKIAQLPVSKDEDTSSDFILWNSIIKF
jgi:hypothetical protein